MTYPLSPAQRQLLEDFQYHQPTPDQIQRISNVRHALKHAAEVIMLNTESSADQTAAVRWVNMGMMTANKAIVCERPKPAATETRTFEDGVAWASGKLEAEPLRTDGEGVKL